MEEDVLLTFLKERKLTGDFISKASDIIWQRDAIKLIDDDTLELPDDTQQKLVKSRGFASVT